MSHESINQPHLMLLKEMRLFFLRQKKLISNLEVKNFRQVELMHMDFDFLKWRSNKMSYKVHWSENYKCWGSVLVL